MSQRGYIKKYAHRLELLWVFFSSLYLLGLNFMSEKPKQIYSCTAFTKVYFYGALSEVAQR